MLAIFFRKTTPTPVLEAAGLISAAIGLVLFLDGLRVAIMPMAMLVGNQLPKRLPLAAVLAVAFFLGVLVSGPLLPVSRPRRGIPERLAAGLRSDCQPMGPLVAVLTVAFGLGVLSAVPRYVRHLLVRRAEAPNPIDRKVTYAEPAIAALRPLAALVDPTTAPYLYYLMNQQQVGLVVDC